MINAVSIHVVKQILSVLGSPIAAGTKSISMNARPKTMMVNTHFWMSIPNEPSQSILSYPSASALMQ